MKQQLPWVSFLFFAATSFASTKTLVDCRGIDEVIEATHKKTGAIGKVYICSQMLKKRPIAIITDKDGDGKLTSNDTIAYYLSKDFTLFKKSLSEVNHDFEKGLESYYKSSKKSSTYYEIKIKSLVYFPDKKEISVDAINEICIKNKMLDREEILNEADWSYSNTSVEDLYRKSFYNPEVDLYLMGERFYDPENGRFLSEDPIGLASGDPNPYRYAKNNPTNYVDPTGLYFERPQQSGYGDQFIEGTQEFYNTYIEMITRRLKDSDKYFHCLASCRASKAGRGGRDAAAFLGLFREVYQLPTDGTQACFEDIEANRIGRNAALSNQSCSQSCHGFGRNRLINFNPLN